MSFFTLALEDVHFKYGFLECGIKVYGSSFMTLWTIWYHLYNLKNVKSTHRGVLLLVMLQSGACNFIKSNTPAWMLLTFLKQYEQYQNLIKRLINIFALCIIRFLNTVKHWKKAMFQKTPFNYYLLLMKLLLWVTEKMLIWRRFARLLKWTVMRRGLSWLSER